MTIEQQLLEVNARVARLEQALNTRYPSETCSWVGAYLNNLNNVLNENPAQSLALHDADVNNKLYALLADISGMCIAELAMNYKLDAQCIGQMIYEATGMTEPELRNSVKEGR
jgi:hypothetical protein